MALNVLVLFFPVVLAIHNLEEYFRYEEFVRVYHSRLPVRLTARRTVFWAAATLTAAAIFICVGAVVSKSQALLLISKVSICALMLNAVSHCLLSLKWRRWLPGIRSACILMLPYSAIALIVMGTTGGTLLRQCFAIPCSVQSQFRSPLLDLSWLGLVLPACVGREDPVNGLQVGE